MLFMPQPTESPAQRASFFKPYFQGVGLRPTGWRVTP